MAERIDKSEILDRTDGGLDIFTRLIPDLPMPPKRGKHFFSVLREEHTPSANLFRAKKSGWWMYKDLGDSVPAMNAIDLLMAVNKIDFKEACKLAADIANIAPLDRPKRPMLPEVRVYPKPALVSRILGNSKSALHVWAQNRFEIPAWQLPLYGIGTWTLGEHIYTAYVFQNIEGQAINVKWMAYKEDGHRNKVIHPKSFGSKEMPPENPDRLETYGLCFFGEHMLAKANPMKPVAIVESEKSAAIAAWFYPDFVWISTAGLNGLGPEDYKRAQLDNGRSVLVLADADPTRKLPKAMQVLRDLNANAHLIDLYPERVDKTDIADYLDEGLKPEIIVPQSICADGIFHNFLPAWAIPSINPAGIAKVVEMPAALLPDPVAPDPEPEPEKETEWARRFRISQEEQIRNLIPEEAFDEEGNDPLNDAIDFNFYSCGGQYWALMSKAGKGNKTDYWTVRMSNFTMKVLFHMEGKKNTRLLEIKNCFGATKTLETDTGNLASKGKFKEFTEGAGNFLFYGGDVDLMNLKSKLFLQEMPCQILEVLGHHPDGFFSFSNGIYREGTWQPVDEKGIIVLDEKAYYIPSGNKTYASNTAIFSNEKKVKHTPRDIHFKDWAKMHGIVFQEPGMAAMLFGISCLFSDIVFQHFNFFPLLFLYGEGGSGKGELIRSIQYLFGKPQDPLHLSSDANTDKSKIREMAQFRNLLINLEEYRNGNEKTVNLLKGLWDRFGYKRARMDGGYGTETVPINSGVMVTGNDYPVDDPLLQRLIVLELNKNTRSQERVNEYHKLREYQDAGITQITLQILDHRKLVEQKFKDQFKASNSEIRKMMEATKITDRMAQNVAVLDAFFQILNPVMPFGFTLEKLRSFLAASMKKQEAKRDTGSETQRFWDVVMSMASRGDIVENRELKFNGDKVIVRFTEIHSQYMLGHRQAYGVPGLNKQSLLDKLKLSEAYEAAIATTQFEDIRSSGQTFSLAKIGVDLTGAFEWKRRQEQARAQDILDKEKEKEEKAKAPEGVQLTVAITPAPPDPEIKDDDLPF